MPAEVLTKIFIILSVEDCLNLAQTCKMNVVSNIDLIMGEQDVRRLWHWCQNFESSKQAISQNILPKSPLQISRV